MITSKKTVLKVRLRPCSVTGNIYVVNSVSPSQTYNPTAGTAYPSYAVTNLQLGAQISVLNPNTNTTVTTPRRVEWFVGSISDATKITSTTSGYTLSGLTLKVTTNTPANTARTILARIYYATEKNTEAYIDKDITLSCSTEAPDIYTVVATTPKKATYLPSVGTTTHSVQVMKGDKPFNGDNEVSIQYNWVEYYYDTDGNYIQTTHASVDGATKDFTFDWARVSPTYSCVKIACIVILHFNTSGNSMTSPRLGAVFAFDRKTPEVKKINVLPVTADEIAAPSSTTPIKYNCEIICGGGAVENPSGWFDINWVVTDGTTTRNLTGTDNGRFNCLSTTLGNLTLPVEVYVEVNSKYKNLKK